MVAARHAESLQAGDLSRLSMALKARVNKTLKLQLAIALVTAVGFAALYGMTAALAVLAGSSGALFLTWLLAVKMHRLQRQLEKGKPVTAPMVALGFAPRLMVVLGLFWIGLWLLRLPPVPMVAGFALTHLGYLLSFYNLKYRHRGWIKQRKRRNS